ncbi:hypothetical protein HBJ58_10170 [Halomonas desiderata]|uniref:hypothetical protein n=1 Tax=Billgrantia desiderata TaxID=52021 RepID=UPI001749C62A|nr:hypothetical protein [Halomonas desiderata]
MTPDILKKRIIQYLKNDAWHRPKQLGVLEHFWEHLPDSVIFGGMIRDFALDFAREFHSDIDIVTLEPSSRLEDVLQPYSPVKNKYGGYRFHNHGYIYDAWSLNDTWAVKNKLIAAENFEDLCHTTFFNLDAIALDFKRKRIYTAPCFHEGLYEKNLEINLSQHPFPSKIAKKGIYLAAKKQLSIGPNLANYILNNFSPDKQDTFYVELVKNMEQHIKRSPGKPFSPHEQLLLNIY